MPEDNSPVDFAQLQAQYPDLAPVALQAIASELAPPRWLAQVQALRERQQRIADQRAD